jgi:phage/plasmid-like protein (TIGR03299 family)
MNTTTSPKVGDSVKVTDSRLRTAPWRTRASWINDTKAGVSAAEVITKAGLDWTVEKAPLTATVLTNSGVTSVEVPGRIATTRVNADGSAKVLGVVSPSYSVVQNAEIADIIDGVTYEAGALYDSAGEIKGGSRIYIAAKMPETVTIGGTDAVDTYIVASNGHDGNQALRIEVKHLRLICTNGMAGWQNLSGVSLKHTSKMDVKVQQIRQTLKVIYAEAEAFHGFATDLLSQPMTDQRFWRIIQEAYPLDDDATDRQVNAVTRTRETVMDIYRGDTQQNIRHTAWGAWQAFVEYADWAHPVRAAKGADLVRAERNLLGGTDDIKSRALELITA